MRSSSFVVSSSARRADAVNIAGIPASTSISRAERMLFIIASCGEPYHMGFAVESQPFYERGTSRRFEYNQFRFNSAQTTYDQIHSVFTRRSRYRAADRS